MRLFDDTEPAGVSIKRNIADDGSTIALQQMKTAILEQFTIATSATAKTYDPAPDDWCDSYGTVWIISIVPDMEARLHAWNKLKTFSEKPGGLREILVTVASCTNRESLEKVIKFVMTRGAINRADTARILAEVLALGGASTEFVLAIVRAAGDLKYDDPDLSRYLQNTLRNLVFPEEVRSEAGIALSSIRPADKSVIGALVALVKYEGTRRVQGGLIAVLRGFEMTEGSVMDDLAEGLRQIAENDSICACTRGEAGMRLAKLCRRLTSGKDLAFKILVSPLEENKIPQSDAGQIRSVIVPGNRSGDPYDNAHAYLDGASNWR